MAEVFNDNIDTRSPKDPQNAAGKWAGSAWIPYATVSEANGHANNNSLYRYIGLTVKVLKSGIPTEYWYRDSTADISLIEKYPTGAITPAALTKVDDTNVTLALGGSPNSALFAATSLALGWTGVLSVVRGGTGQSSYTNGQLLIGNTTGNTLTKATLTAGTGITITNGTGTITIAATGAGVGTVTSVGLLDNSTVPIYNITGSPVTSTGILTFTLTAQNANRVLAGPTTGVAAQPTFRSLVAADVPTLSYWGLTGTAGTTAGTNYLGTPDNIDVVLKRNAVEGLRLVNGTVRIPQLGTLLVAPVATGLIKAVVADENGDLSETNLTVLTPGFFWGISGNSNTVPGTNFIGTTPGANEDVVFKRNGVEIMRMYATGLNLGQASNNSGRLAFTALTSGTFIQTVPNTVSSWTAVWPATSGINGYVLATDGSGVFSWVAQSGGGGTVTSIALADGSTTPIYSVSGSPITGSGALTLTLGTQTANKVFAGPTTGSAAQPTFRSLVAADIASLFTANNGITASTTTNFQLGSTSGPGSALLHDSYINADTFNLIITGSASNVFKAYNTGTGSAIYGESSAIAILGNNTADGGSGVKGLSTGSGSIGVSGIADSGIGISGQSTTGIPGYLVRAVSGAATVDEVLRIFKSTSATPTAGIAGYISFQIANTSSSATEAGRFISKLTAISPVTSSFEWQLKNTGTLARKMALLGTGQIVMDGYGVNAFAGTPTYAAGWDASGNLIEYAVGSGGGSGVSSIDVSGGSTGLTTSGGPVTSTGTITLAGTLITSNGGTGLTSWTQGDIPYYTSGTVLSKLAKSATANQYIKNSGTSNAPAWGTIAASDIGSTGNLTKADDTNVTLTLGGTPTGALLNAASLTLGWSGTLAATRGGTGTGTVAIGDILYGSATNVWSKLAIGSTGQALVITGGVPSWGNRTYTATNGLTMTSNNTVLGGNLDGDTDINTTSTAFYKLTLTNIDLYLANGAGTGGNRGNIVMANDRNIYWGTFATGPFMSGSIATGNANFYASGSGKVKLGGPTQLVNYGGGTQTGTATYNLAVTSDGSVIEVATSGGGGGTTTNALSIAAELHSGGSTTFDGSGAISIAIQAASVTGNMIASSVALAGSPTTTTQTAGDNSTKIATTSFVTTAISNAVSAINPAVAVEAATTANLSGYTYSNGVSGVGATLTQNSAAVVIIDGYTLLLNDRILFKNQSTAANNGVYVITTLGTGVIPAVFTRASDYNQPSDINNTGAIPVINGTANATTSWLLTSSVTTIGTDSLSYTQFSYAPSDIVTLTGTQTLVNKTFTAPKFADLGFIADANGNELIILDTVTSAVNEITLANAATGNSPTLTATGGDSNVSVKFVPKGTGVFYGTMETLCIPIGDETTSITTGTAKVTFRMPYAFKIIKVKASLTTSSSSGTPTFDINEAGTTILSTKLTIDASELTSKTAAAAAVISDNVLADDAEMTIDIDVAGTSASGAKIYLIGYATSLPS